MSGKMFREYWQQILRKEEQSMCIQKLFRRSKSPEIRVSGNRMLIKHDPQDAVYGDLESKNLPAVRQEAPAKRPTLFECIVPNHIYGM